MAATAPPDSDLIHEIAKGGTAGNRAAAIIFDRYAAKLMGFFMRRGFSREDSEELLQETLIKFVRYAREREGDCTVGLLWNAARTLAVDHLRARYAEKRDAGANVSLEQAAIENFAAEEGGDDGLMDCVDGSIQEFRRIAPERAETVERVIIEGWGMKELAEFLGRSYGATRQYVCECRKKLRELVRERCSDYLNHESDCGLSPCGTSLELRIIWTVF
jgi:RNA polymerase sigma-70 factor (ECF subfamily)